jgi:toxin ParE1/3/4
MSIERPLRIVRSSRARSDLLDIWLYISDDSVAAADRVLDEINRVCRLISEHPKIGRVRPEIGAELRSFAAMSWIVFYRIDDDAIRIVRIVHGARDFDQLDF